MDNLTPGKNNKGITSAIILTVVAVGVLAVLGIPSLRGLRYQAQASAQAKYDYESGKKFVNDVQTTYTRLTSSGLDKQLSIAAPADVDIPAALVQLDAMVAQAGLTLNSLSPSTSGGQTNVNLIVSGDYAQLQTFLKLIETNLRPFDIQSVAINTFESDGKIKTAGTYDIVLSKNKNATSENQSTSSSNSVTVTSK